MMFCNGGGPAKKANTLFSRVLVIYIQQVSHLYLFLSYRTLSMLIHLMSAYMGKIVAILLLSLYPKCFLA